MSNPLLIYCGHHKSGSQWIFNVMKSIGQALGLRHELVDDPASFGFDLGDFCARQGVELLSYVNADYAALEGLELRGVHVVRDPRDMLVSGYFSHLQSHRESDWPLLQAYRPVLRDVDKSSGLLLEMEFSSRFFAHMASWPGDVPGVLPVKFEELIADPAAQFQAIVRHLGLVERGLDDAVLAEILAKLNFETLTKGRAAGQEDVGKHYRRGVAGDWKRHFTAAHVWAFKQRYNDLLIRYGYEADDQWQGAAEVEPELTARQVDQLIMARLREPLRRLILRWR